MTISGRGQDFTLERIYGSQEDYVATDTLYGDTLTPNNLHLWRTPLGFGWTHSFNIFLDSLEDSDVGTPHHMILHDTDGNELDYKYEGGVYKSQTGDRNILKRSSGTPDTLILYKPDGTRYYFNQWRRINSIEDKNGNRIRFTYSPNSDTGDLVKITDTMGREYDLTYENHLLRRLYEGRNIPGTPFVEYRYHLLPDTIINYPLYNLTQVLKHTLSSGIDSLIVMDRYYYDNDHNIIQHIHPTGGYMDDNDTTWTAHKNKGDRVSCWFDSNRKLQYQEVVKGDGDTILSNDRVIYKAFFEYAVASNGYTDSTIVYYYQGPADSPAHNPFDTTFTPVPPTTNFFRKVIKFYTSTSYKSKRERERTRTSTGVDLFGVDYLSYNAENDPTQIQNFPIPDITKYWYGSYTAEGQTKLRAQPDSIQYPDGNKVRFYLNIRDVIKYTKNFWTPDSIKDELGRRTDYRYDSTTVNLDTLRYFQRRLAGSSGLQDVSTDYNFNNRGNLLQIKDAKGNITRFKYGPADTGAYLTESRIDIGNDGDDNKDIVTQYFYNNSNGNLDSTRYYHDYPTTGFTVKYTYDVLKRVKEISYPDTTKEVYTYDKRGNILTKEVKKGIIPYSRIIYEYDAQDHLTKVKEDPDLASPGVDSTLYVYNQHGEMIEFSNSNDSPTTNTTIQYTYDAGRLKNVRYADGTLDSLTYNDCCNVALKVDRKGQVIEHGYNSRGWLEKKRYFQNLLQYPSNPLDSVVFKYDAVGNNDTLIDKHGLQRFVYDGLDRLDSLNFYNRQNVHYEYDLVGNRTLMKVSKATSPFTIHFEQSYTLYDEANRLKQTWANGELYTLDYWDTGQVKKITYPNNTWETYTLTPRNFIQSVTSSKQEGTGIVDLFGHAYTYNELGDRKVTSLKLKRPTGPDISGTINYTYDAIRRLTKASYSGINQNRIVDYVYDPVGNRMIRTNPNVTYSYNLHEMNPLTETIS